MPDPPPGKRRYEPSGVAVRAESALRYAELWCRSNFSFLQGASHPDELVAEAARLGYAALAVTDRQTLAGVARAHMAAKDQGLKLIVGTQIEPLDGTPLVLWAADRASYGRLARLLTVGQRRAPKGECYLYVDDVAQHATDLWAGAIAPNEKPALNASPPYQGGVGGVSPPSDPRNNSFHSQKHHERPALNASPPYQGGVGGVSPSSDPRNFELRSSRTPVANAPGSWSLECYREIFGTRLSLLAALSRRSGDRRRREHWRRLAARIRVPLLAGGDVRFHIRQRRALFDVLTAIRAGCTVAEAAPLLPSNAEHYLRPLEELALLWDEEPQALARSVEIAEACTFSLDELRYEYPEELAPPGLTPMEHLRRLAWEGAARRYPDGLPDKVRGLIEHELTLIEELRYEAYFLTVWDLMRFARSRGILCQGRGSAANSAVCYCLEVTSVDPGRIDLLFERFVSRERNEAPDIDVDFEHERREEVLQYLYEKYGRERAGLVAEVITYRPRSAVRDVGKALGLSLDRVDALAKNLDSYNQEPRLGERCAEVGLPPEGPLVAQLMTLTHELLGFPRHLSQHVGGMVMTRGALCELVPIQNAAMPGRTVIEWDKDDLDELGILKVDCLALGMLTAIRKCFDLVERHAGRKLTLAHVPEGDEATYDMIREADTIGVFQIESRAQMSMLPRLRPANYYDLVIEVAIVRPGPIQGNMVHPFLRRRRGLEPIDYPNEAIREVLQKTLGVPIFQEQAMRLAIVAAGFTPGEADQLRRAMGGWRRPGLIESFHQKLIAGMIERGLSAEYAERVFNQLRGFGEYGFPESHAASFALLAYVSAWLKCHYPAAFAAGLINSQPMGFYAPAQLVRDAREHGVPVLPADVNHSHWHCTLEEVLSIEPAPSNSPPYQGGVGGVAASRANPQRSLALRLGLRLLRGLSEADFSTLADVRGDRPFRSVEDFARRMPVPRGALVRLAQGGAFESLGGGRRDALWEALGESNQAWGLKPRDDERLLPLEEPPSNASPPYQGGVGRVSSTSDPSKSSFRSQSPLEKQAPSASPPYQGGVGGVSPTSDPSNSAFRSQSPLEKQAPNGVGKVSFPPLTLAEEVTADYQTAGLSLRAHPMSFVRERLASRRVLTAVALETATQGRIVQTAGLVLLRQRPATASGITFVTLEDETGTANLVVRPDVWQKFRRAARHAKAMLVRGRVDRQGRVVHVVVTRITDLSDWLAELKNKSRDFR